jgi:ubiquinol-cytochrome c reductase cytochrome b subunit
VRRNGALGMAVLRKVWRWIEERTGIGGTLQPLGSHLAPPGAKWWYVFGSATLFAFAVQVITGIALATVYVPSAGSAYESLQYISTQSPAGALLRGMHYFGASAMVLFVGVHMIRVFLTGSYKFPREVSWLTGVALLALTIVMGFTGQLLRWDQNAVWSAVVGAEQAGRTPFIGRWLVRIFFSGSTIGSATLSHFFVLHVFVVPALIVLAISFHLYLVVRNGISEPAVPGQTVDPDTYRERYQSMLKRSGVPFWPYAAWRDAAFSGAMIVGILLLAWAFGAPQLGQPPDPSIIEAKPRPDWYLMWYFAVLALLPHEAENYVMILAPLVGGLVLLAVPFLSNRGERNWRRRPWAPAIVALIVMCVGVLWHAGVQAPWSPDFSAQPLTASIIGVSAGPVYEGGQVFNTKGCLYCHTISYHGGRRGPNLTYIGDRLNRNQMIIRITNGGYNMPAYANNITPSHLDALVVFLQSRKATY